MPSLCSECNSAVTELLLAEVFYLEVGNFTLEVAGFFEWEYKCAYIVHLILATFVVVECLLVECLYQFAVYKELCHILVSAYSDMCLLAREASNQRVYLGWRQKKEQHRSWFRRCLMTAN